MLAVLVAPVVSLAQSAVTPLQLMRAADAHAKAHGAKYRPVLSPMDSPDSGVSDKDIVEVRSAGFPVIVWTIDDLARQQQLLDSGVDGIISDRPDLLRTLVERNRTARGGLLDAQGLLRYDKFDAQGHRGGRDLRPESTFPAFEIALDNLVTTLETDLGVSSDGVAVLSHERHVNRQTCREPSAAGSQATSEVLIKDVTAEELRRRFVCDQIIRGPSQSNDLQLSPVTVAFVSERHLPNAFVHPRLQELFDFVSFYARYYSAGPGRTRPDAQTRSANARRVRFNLETKIDARSPHDTVPPDVFVKVVAGTITKNRLQSRCDIQSFDFRTLVIAQRDYPAIRTVYLVGSAQQLLLESLSPELRSTSGP